ncbi:MAG: hypothetical protein HY272_09245 [Gammaproteobacteria bacterium]|nr:hypothetical protein [Gammaproteobacteria bacterium]
MNHRSLPIVLASWITALSLLLVNQLALGITAPVMYGTLSNFDVINDTGQPTNGFEIELEGISPGDVVYTFGDSGNPAVPYIRYGKPTVLRNAAGTGTIVRYASTYVGGVFIEATPSPTPPYPVTMGHQCWIYGDPVHYPTSGCEHFGVSLIGNPTKTTYRWLVGNNVTGKLSVVGSPGNPSIPAPVNVPAPIWNVNQAPPPPGVPPAQPPVVVAVVQAPPAPPLPPAGKGQWGDAIWMKIYKTELSDPADLNDLVPDGADVPNPAEPPEIEWQLLQSAPLDKPDGINESSENGGEAGAGNEAVSRTYEFYKYTGAYDPDPENFHEAFCDNPTAVDQQIPERCGAPDANGVAGVGDLIGAQNAAINLVAACAVDVSSSIAVKRSGYLFNFGTKLFSQNVTLTNTSNAPIFGPISLVLDNLNLSGNAGLFNVAGTTSCTAPQNSPYADSSINTSVASLAPGASVSMTLQFSNPAKTSISYTPRVLSTSGMR